MFVPITEVAKGLLRVGPIETGRVDATGKPSGPTSPYLAVGQDRVAILEPGEDGQMAALMEAIKVCDVDEDRIDYIWASHIHFHHIQVLPKLLKRLPKAKFLVHPRGAPHLMEPTRLIQSTIEVFGDKCYGPFEAIPKERIVTVEDNQIIDLGGKQLQVIYAPGHAPHHMGLFDLETRALFYGDVAVLGTPGKWRGHHDIRPPLFDVDKFVETIRRYQALNASMILTFTYGGVSHSPQDTLRWALEDHLAIQRICLDGMKNKMSAQEMALRSAIYESAAGTGPDVEPGATGGTGGIFGIINFLKRKYPDLEVPGDISRRLRSGAARGD